MTEAFAHLHVASSFSMQYGASTPRALVETAAEQGQRILGLTDRDGLYGAVRFVQACAEHRVRPVLGVDLACAQSPMVGGGGAAAGARRDGVGVDRAQIAGAGGPRGQHARRSPAKGGVEVDPRWPRVCVLARGRSSGLSAGAGWGNLCELVTATHLAGERGRPVTTPALLAQAAAGPHGKTATAVLLGPSSDVGRAVLSRRDREAMELLRRWRALLPHDGLFIEVVCHDGPPHTPGSLQHAARMWRLARAADVPAVLTSAARHARAEQAMVADLLDAARRMRPLDERHLDRTTTAGHLAPTVQMHQIAARVIHAAGGRPQDASVLLATTEALAAECAQDRRVDLGIGAVHLPEPEILGLRDVTHAQAELARRCREAIATRYPAASHREITGIEQRLSDELATIEALGYPTYFMTVAQVCDLIRDAGVRVAARGSGAGSLVNYLLGISGVDPMRHGLLMERFCTPLRAQLPDIDIDVESDRRTQMYERILDHFGSARVTCVSMMETYKVRHAVRDTGAALGMSPAEVDTIAKAFPHIRAKDARQAIADLPELAAQGLGAPRLERFFELVESLDGLPRHIAMHPCGVLLSNSGLLRRTPVEASWLGFPMSQFDKDDVEELGLLKLDVLGIRMQSAMSHAIDEISRVDGITIDLDDETQVPLDDPDTYALIGSTRTLGCFQIESPGQRELIGKFGPETFEDIIIDISLFRPGPVKSDMVTPFLMARQGWREPEYLHDSLKPYLASTCGVVVFHEQVLQIVAETTGVSLARADEVRRAMGTPEGQDEVEVWWREAARQHGYGPGERDAIWEVLAAFASFGFCKAHAAAFALPTFQSAWLKTHHPAAFLAGVLTHDPGMYPKRLILDDARNHGVRVLGLDVNASGATYRVEKDADGAYGIRISLADVSGIHDDEVARIEAAAPYTSLSDFWHRALVSRPTAEHIILAGGFDAIHGVGGNDTVRGRTRLTRRDLLLHLAELDRWTRATRTSGWGRSRRGRGGAPQPEGGAPDIAAATAAQAQGRRPGAQNEQPAVQLALDLDDAPELVAGSGLPELDSAEKVQAELDILGLDVSTHLVRAYIPMLQALGVVPARDLRSCRNGSTVLVAGVKVATQTPPVRSGRRVIFLTLDDSTGPSDCTFFEDVQGPYSATVFHSWLLLVQGVVRRTGPRGVSLRATGAWELTGLWSAWEAGGIDAVHGELAQMEELAQARSAAHEQAQRDAAGRRVLVHASGFRQSPYADIRPAGEAVSHAPRKLWHSSPGSPGR